MREDEGLNKGGGNGKGMNWKDRSEEASSGLLRREV